MAVIRINYMGQGTASVSDLPDLKHTHILCILFLMWYDPGVKSNNLYHHTIVSRKK